MVGVLAAVASSASATFPGRNGLIAVASNRGCDLNGAVHTVRLDGSGQRRVTECRHNTRVFDWSPRGRRLVFITDPYCPGCPPGVAPDRVITVRPDGSHAEVLDESSAVFDVKWGPDGRDLAWAGQTGAAGEERTGVFVGPFESPFETYIAPWSSFAWSPDGRSLAVTETVTTGRAGDPGCARISIFDASSGTRTRVLVPRRLRGGRCYGGGRAPSWSPDGRRIVFGGWSRDQRQLPQKAEIFVVRADGRHRRRLTDNPVSDIYPVWSPDGKWIAYTRPFRYHLVHNLYVMHADGTRKRLVVRSAIRPAWQPRP